MSLTRRRTPRSTPYLQLLDDSVREEKVVVIGPGVVGMPMAALLAQPEAWGGDLPSRRVVVLQRRSPTSGWKVDAINSGKSSIGGIEPGLDALVAKAVADGRLRASDDYAEATDADVIIVCVQTDKKGIGPDYGPLFASLTPLAEALKKRPEGRRPLIVIESTLAPSSMQSVVRELFAAQGLEDGRDILLGNSPNRVMPGRLVERVADSDKIVGGLRRETVEAIARYYRPIVRNATLHLTNSMTAEIVKTLENAYRDVRIAFSAEVCRYCDDNDVDFYQVRDAVNAILAQTDKASREPGAVPTGGLLIPTVGVGGHCLPKDGILLWWRAQEAGECKGQSLILEARTINDESPKRALEAATKRVGSLAGWRVAVLGAAYRFDSDDTRNSPSLELGKRLREAGAHVVLHDPWVRQHDQNLVASGLAPVFTQNLSEALQGTRVAFVTVAHRAYLESVGALQSARSLGLIVDCCNAFRRSEFGGNSLAYIGMGRGTKTPSAELLDDVHEAFLAMERGVANEVWWTVKYLNERYAPDTFSQVRFEDVQRLAGTCITGCTIPNPGPVDLQTSTSGFVSRLANKAARGHH